MIEDFSLAIAPGEKVGLVGRSGAGKSTLVNLLLRFYDLEGGRILIDGQDIAQVTQESLRSQIGMVTQDTSLLHRSVRDNIRYGRPDATEAEIIAAARQAEADDFIRDLADAKGRTGYDAHVGERGVKLSGGQRQRIAIARVLLKDAPILILDEATSALDSEVEAAIQELALPADGGQDRDRHRPPAVDHRRHGPARGARPRPDRRDRHPRGTAPPRRPLRPALEPPVRRLPRRGPDAGGGGVELPDPRLLLAAVKRRRRKLRNRPVNDGRPEWKPHCRSDEFKGHPGAVSTATQLKDIRKRLPLRVLSG